MQFLLLMKFKEKIMLCLVVCQPQNQLDSLESLSKSYTVVSAYKKTLSLKQTKLHNLTTLTQSCWNRQTNIRILHNSYPKVLKLNPNL